jgi:hypothetical protein
MAFNWKIALVYAAFAFFAFLIVAAFFTALLVAVMLFIALLGIVAFAPKFTAQPLGIAVVLILLVAAIAFAAIQVGQTASFSIANAVGLGG